MEKNEVENKKEEIDFFLFLGSNKNKGGKQT